MHVERGEWSVQDWKWGGSNILEDQDRIFYRTKIEFKGPKESKQKFKSTFFLLKSCKLKLIML